MLPILLPQRCLFSLGVKPPEDDRDDRHDSDGKFDAGGQAIALLVNFLEKIITADTKPLLAFLPIYSALLTANGKYIADFFITPQGNKLLIETDATLAPTLMTTLQRYILRQPIEIEKLSMAVAVAFDKPVMDNIFFMTDPRPADKKSYRLYGAIEKYSSATDDYHRWRIDNCLPEGTMDFFENESLIVEYHLQSIGGLSLQKGCFIGQEVTARIYYKQAMEQKLKKQLVTKIIDADATINPDNKILSSVIVGDKKHVLLLEKNHR